MVLMFLHFVPIHEKVIHKFLHIVNPLQHHLDLPLKGLWGPGNPYRQLLETQSVKRSDKCCHLAAI